MYLTIGQTVGIIAMILVGIFMIGWAFYRPKKKEFTEALSAEPGVWKSQELTALREINRYRLRNGLPALLQDQVLYKESGQRSIEHSQLPDIVWKKQGHQLFYLHEARLKSKGYQITGEVISRGHTRGFDVVRGWKNSSNHRDSLKSPHWTHAGITVFKGTNDNGDSQWYWTAVFGRRKELVT